MSAAAPRVFLTAEWRWLVMVNFEVDPALLTPLVPAGTELDLWRGRALASVVGFRFLRTRILGVPVPFHRDFDEVNLRFYVRRVADGEVRRGVVFVREVVPRGAIAFVARTVYNERYVSLPMRSRITPPSPDAAGRFEYAWHYRGRWNRVAASVSGEPALTAADGEETFVTEHYWGYAAQPDGSTVEYAVEHPRWRVWTARDVRFECDVARLYGPGFVPWLTRPPTSAFVADGSAVCVRRGRRLTPC
jgi:uncharacterized protein YqjF (DUF2071 family)